MATLVEKYKATFTAEEIDEIWTQWVLAGTSWQNFQGPAQVMKSVKDANGNWLYSEGCIDPELADAGEPDDPDGVPNMDMGGMGKKKKKVRALHASASLFQEVGTAQGADESRSRSCASALTACAPARRRSPGWSRWRSAPAISRRGSRSRMPSSAAPLRSWMPGRPDILWHPRDVRRQGCCPKQRQLCPRRQARE